MIASLTMPCPLKILTSFADFPAPTSARVVCVHFDSAHSVVVSNEIDRSTCTNPSLFGRGENSRYFHELDSCQDRIVRTGAACAELFGRKCL